MSFLEESKMSQVRKIQVEERGTTEKLEGESQARGAKETVSEMDHPPEVENFDNRLDQIEKRIRELGDQLRDLHNQSLKFSEKDVKARLDYEDKRTDLRKRLIVLSQEHKDMIEMKHRKEAEPAPKKESEEKSNPPPPEEHPPQEQSPSEEEAPKAVPTKAQDLEAQLSKSRAQARVADIQLELALTDLRLSRRRALQAELSSIRLRYTYLSSPYLYSGYPYYRSLYSYPYYRRWLWY